MLDVSPSRHAGCAVPAEEEQEARGSLGLLPSGSGSSSRGRALALPPLPAAVEVRLSQAPVCVAAHPAGEMLVAGGSGGRLSVLMER